MNIRPFILLLVAGAGVGYFVLKSKAEHAQHDRVIAEAEAYLASNTPDLDPPENVRPLDPKALSKAADVFAEDHCATLGKAIRHGNDEFTRAMIQRTADLHLGALKLNDQAAIRNTQIHLGMTACMAEASWGKPKRVNRSVGSYGTHEQWVYPANYLYFEDGILTSFQE